MTWPDRFISKLGITYPVVQAPMLGVTSPEMVAAVSNAGGLGSLPVGSLSHEVTRQLVRKTAALTSKPFAVNLFVNDDPVFNKPVIDNMQDFLESLCSRYGIKYQRQANFQLHSYQDQIKVLIEEKVKVVSFTFGVLDQESINDLKQNGIVLIGTSTTLEEALMLENRGIDCVIAQGIEAGGHRGSFLNIDVEAQQNTADLLSAIVGRIKTPVIAAGGIFDSSGIKSSFDLGAGAVQIGSAFICSHESLAIPSYKSALTNSREEDSILTRVFSGRWARGLRNIFIKELEKSKLDIPDYPLQVVLTSSIRSAAIASDNNNFTALWAGRNARMAEFKAAKEILLQLVRSFEEVHNT